MTTTTISPVRQRMIEDMRLRNLAPRTQEAYIRGCKKLAAKRPAATISYERIKPSISDWAQFMESSIDLFC
jgi:integrase/recombinase XerD